MKAVVLSIELFALSALGVHGLANSASKACSLLKDALPGKVFFPGQNPPVPILIF
jgi:hypothetical protein